MNHITAPDGAAHQRHSLLERFKVVRATTEALAAPLSPEDQAVQSMPEASPTKWHRAHTTWFFETVLLQAFDRHYKPHDTRYGYLFNSYYEALGARHPRPARGLLTRPSADEVTAYRTHVDAATSALLTRAGETDWNAVAPVVTLGLHHEQQHQELILTDILHLFSCNALRPAYHDDLPAPGASPAPPLAWAYFEGGKREIGHAGPGFAYDNETPRHPVLLAPFELANRCVTNGEWRAFMDDRGYGRPELWLADGWAAVAARDWQHPDYWYRGDDGRWWSQTLAGPRPVADACPVTHVSFYEADAYARWAGARLPTEAEWEAAATDLTPRGNTADAGFLDPRPAQGTGPLLQMFGDVWEWTMSPYTPYPGFRPMAGVLAEYNGKFMCNQMVLRGGSCVTPEGHVRATYRNFFYPHERWQFTGLRLARDA